MSGSATTPNGSATSAVEYVRALSDEEKGLVFIALLRELIEVNGGGKCLIPIDTPEGESLGYYVPPKAAAARFEMYGPKFTPAEWAELEERVKNPGPALPADQVIAELRAQLAELEKQRP